MSRIPFILESGKKISKKIEKKIKKLKNLFPELFLAKTGVDMPKKRESFFLPRFPIIAWGRKFRKKIAKKLKN